MGTVALVKPGLVTNAVQVPSGGTQKLGSSGSMDYFIKVMRHTSDSWSPDEELTGDGDEQPCFENSLQFYQDLILDGALTRPSQVPVYPGTWSRVKSLFMR